MTPQQIEMIQQSFSHLAPVAQVAGELFYENLFEIAPETRPMFPDDISGQAGKLMSAIAMTVGALRAPEALAPKLHELGQKHAYEYGVEAGHYDIVGTALIKTLEMGLADIWSPELEAAWSTAYGFVAETMQAGQVVARVGKKLKAPSLAQAPAGAKVA